MTLNTIGTLMITIIIGLAGYAYLKGPSPELLYMQTHDLQDKLRDLDKAQRLFESTIGIAKHAP